jgi:predicted sulfurtransferase
MEVGASVVGILSLGLQVTGGIVKYVSALDGQHDEFLQIRRHNDALRTTLIALKTLSPSLQGHSAQLSAAAEQHFQLLNTTLRKADELHVKLAAQSGSTNWKTKVKNGTKLVTYPFRRPELQSLAQYLHEANCNLQLALQGLGLWAIFPCWFDRFTDLILL